MRDSPKDKLGGELREVKGKIKEKVGGVTNNPAWKALGQNGKSGGEVQRKIGHMEKVPGTQREEI